ncbi:hypothetical protein [Amycolatopsis sp. NBC_01480]|uniref:hypothetical protein n=1 Tax=Amycolatopsis sp. NBC_01480 TaxID=2903562 RepID=UPI002E2A46F7|nr:hypothetical protein [Amycolatopsis sp. NBC_01480]
MTPTTQKSTSPAVPGRARRLAEDAREAAEVRRWQTHPDVVALRVERVRTQVDRLCWSGIVLGLAFTTANVQWFAASGSAVGSLPWLTAWLLDPTVCLVLLAILRAEQVTARYQVHTGAWVRAAKWLTLAATYVMNTWSSWVSGSPAGVVLHSVPPLVVFVAAEAVTDVRDKLTDAVTVALVNATGHAHAVAGREPAAPDREPNTSAPEPNMPGRELDAQAAPPDGPRPARAVRRRLFADYLTDARAAWTPEVDLTPLWVREVTGCSRGVSSRIAATLTAESGEGVRRDG